MYGGHQAGAVHLPPDTLPSGWACVVCGGGQQPPKHLPTGFTLAPEDAYTPDLVRWFHSVFIAGCQDTYMYAAVYTLSGVHKTVVVNVRIRCPNIMKEWWITVMQVAAADCVLGKIGYGTASECLAHATPLVYVRRESFNEVRSL